MERVYNKLVREKIPVLIEGKYVTPVTSILNDDECKLELEKKLYEDYMEVIESSGEDRLFELADMIEVIKSLALLSGKTLEDIIELANGKRIKRGGFEKKIFLEKDIETK